MYQEIWTCDACGREVPVSDLGREVTLRVRMAPRPGCARPAVLAADALDFVGTATRSAVFDDHAPNADDCVVHVDRMVCASCWPNRPRITVQIGPGGIATNSTAQPTTGREGEVVS
jgi:hypothetical protein